MSSSYKNYTDFEKLLENQQATESEFFAKSYEKCKILSEFLKTKIINLDDYACPKVQFLYLNVKNLIAGLANTHFDMQKLFTVQKEKLLQTDMDSTFFLTNCKS